MIIMDLIILVICSSGCNGCGNCIVFEVCSCNSGYIGNVCIIVVIIVYFRCYVVFMVIIFVVIDS